MQTLNTFDIFRAHVAYLLGGLEMAAEFWVLHPELLANSVELAKQVRNARSPYVAKNQARMFFNLEIRPQLEADRQAN